MLHMQERPGQQVGLTTEAFSRMEPDGPFSVWDLTGNITCAPDVQGLRRVIVYHSIRSQDPVRTPILLQVELTHSLASIARRMTSATLQLGIKRSWLQLWQAPGCPDEVLCLLLQGTVDIRSIQNVPHQLILWGGEGGEEGRVVLDNIMLR